MSAQNPANQELFQFRRRKPGTVFLGTEPAPGATAPRGRGRPPGSPTIIDRPVKCGRCGCDDPEQFPKRGKVECSICLIERKYGLPVGGFRRMADEQGNVCRICEGDNNGRRLFVDHCHATGVVRGLLCNRCNTSLGFIEMNLHRLDDVLAYLARAPRKESA